MTSTTMLTCLFQWIKIKSVISTSMIMMIDCRNSLEPSLWKTVKSVSLRRGIFIRMIFGTPVKKGKYWKNRGMLSMWKHLKRRTMFDVRSYNQIYWQWISLICLFYVFSLFNIYRALKFHKIKTKILLSTKWKPR